VAALVEKIIRDNRPDAGSTADVEDLPFPFWQPVDTILMTADDYVISTMRSNATRNFIGQVLTVAAGYIKSGETDMQCAERELLEETGLVWADEVDPSSICTLDIITERPLQRYDEKAVARPKGVDSEPINLICCCPNVVSTIAARTQKTLEQLPPSLKLNYESAGLLSLKIDDFVKIAETPLIHVPAKFWPSVGLDLMQEGLPELVERREDLELLRQELVGMGAANNRLPKDEVLYGLKESFDIMVSAGDFMKNDSPEILEKTVQAARLINPVAATPFIPPRVALSPQIA
jgi:NUDIX domain